MDWKYFIPHIWDREREIWEDVYLLPIQDNYDGQAILLTIDALGNVEDAKCDREREEFQLEALEKLGNKSFHIEGSDMLVRSEDFTKEELLMWVRIWLQENEFLINNLVEGTEREFCGKAFHAELIAQWREDGCV